MTNNMMSEVTNQGNTPLTHSDGPGELLTVAEAADVLGIGKTTMFHLLKTEIPSLKIGRARRIPANTLAKWVMDAVRREVEAGDPSI